MIKKGLVLEGGAMRGLFSAGVMDVFMENGITFDGAVGVSAGACFGCNYKSGQIGRVIRYNKKYCKDKRFKSLYSLIKTGDVYGADFAYRKLPHELDLFDYEAYKNNEMEFYVVCTDVDTGKAIYYKCETCDDYDLDWMRASASMPVVSRIVEIDGKRLSDGGTSDSIPLKFFEEKGYNKNIVICTQPKGFKKEPSKLMTLIELALGKEKVLIDALKNRHIMYNEELDYIRKSEEKGTALIIYPDEKLDVGAVEHNEKKIDKAYISGRQVALKELDKVKRFLEE